MPVLVLYVGKLIIDEVIMINRTGTHAFAHLWTLIAAEFAIAFVSDALGRMLNLLDSLLGDQFSNRTSIQLMEHAATLDLVQFEESSFYDKLERARQQTTGRTVLLSQVLSQLQDLITMVFLLGGLIAYYPWLIVLLVLAVIPSFMGESYFNQQSYSLVRNWTPERRELDYLRYTGASDETAKEVKIFGLSGFLVDRFRDLSIRYYQANKRLSAQRALWGGVFAVLSSIGYYSAYVFIIWETIHARVTIGGLTFLAGSFRQLRALLETILTRFTTVSQSALYLNDLFDFLAIKPSIDSQPAARPFPSTVIEGFTFVNVGFKYPNSDKWAIRNLDFTFRAGEKLALVGENGSGKTTLVKLIARLYDPDEGVILLDGVDLKAYDLENLRENIGIIFQDFVRYQFTASENIAVGKIDERADRPKIEGAAAQSMAGAVIEKLPAQYDQMLGKRFASGVDLSGGEWQKIGLGRAYMRNAKVLILDEPTAALDARAEYEAFLRFTELTTGKMAVLISHRFSTVRVADRILVLDKGKIVEIGSHEELLANNGRYAELFRLQAKGYQ